MQISHNTGLLKDATDGSIALGTRIALQQLSDC